MSYAKLIDLNLTRAFNRLKDLAKLATVVKKTDVAFDFGTGESSETTTTISFKVAIVESTKGSERNSMETQIMFKKADVGDLMAYDTVTIDGVSYKVGSAVKNDGYISVVNIHREA
jgi:hypothetical protein